MAITDPIADMLTRIRNAAMLNRGQVLIPASKVKLEILKVLKKEDFITDFKFEKDGNVINIDLNNEISKLIRVSKPGRRVYTPKDSIPTVLQGRGLIVISTSKGIMAGKEAKKRGLGGEIICKVW
ncbi:MAG: 30S ribosomal protein S8 [bacterium]